MYLIISKLDMYLILETHQYCLTESPYTKAISDGVLRLQEKGILTLLYNKWWNQMYVPEEPCVSLS